MLYVKELLSIKIKGCRFDDETQSDRLETPRLSFSRCHVIYSFDNDIRSGECYVLRLR